ncbi:MAG: hypothetical protein JXB19_04745 [Bacteroidales bacterium]|nr:hypothetical protein [Bacteroidales bacterium]
MENSAGWVKIYREITKHWLWQNDKYLKRWMTILLFVNHAPSKFNAGHELYTCPAGSSYRSLSEWASLFNTNKRQVKSFFDLLQSDNMISRQILGKGNQRKHLLSVVNWDKYQQSGTEDKSMDTQYSSNIATNDGQKSQKRNQTETALLLVQQEKISKNDFAMEPKTEPKRYPEQEGLRINKNNKNISKESGQEKPLPKKPNIPYQIVSEFKKVFTDYVEQPKDFKMANTLYGLWKKKHPDCNEEQSLMSLKDFFIDCKNIRDRWYQDNMSLATITSKFNEVIRILSKPKIKKGLPVFDEENQDYNKTL